MPRARNIKPGFFKNEDLAECSLAARLCFAGLWTLADREGRLEDRPKRIKGELFPFDAFDVEPLLSELARHRFIVRYESDAVRVIQIPKFAEHQAPHYSEKPSVIKPPTLPESSQHHEPAKSGTGTALRGGRNPLNPDSLNPDSGITTPTGVDGPPLRAAPPPPPDFDGRNSETLNGKAVVAIAGAWELPEAWGVDAEALGWNASEVLREAEKFRQYWTAGKGKGKRRNVKGWRQSWSNWLAKAAEQRR